jgi:hypothetical protein
VAGNLQEVAVALQGFGGPLLSPPQAQAGLDQLLRSVGQMLQDADKREARVRASSHTAPARNAASPRSSHGVKPRSRSHRGAASTPVLARLDL